MLGDQQSALFGQTCFQAGQAKATYGTGAFLLLNTGHAIVPSDRGLLTTVAFRLGKSNPVYALEGAWDEMRSGVEWSGAAWLDGWKKERHIRRRARAHTLYILYTYIYIYTTQINKHIRYGTTGAAGSIAYCGSLIQWLRDNMGILKTTAESEALASKVVVRQACRHVCRYAGR